MLPEPAIACKQISKARDFLSTDAEARTSRYNGPGGRGLHHEFRHFRQQNLLLRLGKYTKALEVMFSLPPGPSAAGSIGTGGRTTTGLGARFQRAWLVELEAVESERTRGQNMTHFAGHSGVSATLNLGNPLESMIILTKTFLHGLFPIKAIAT